MGKILTGRFTKSSMIKYLGFTGTIMGKLRTLKSSFNSTKRAFKLQKDKDVLDRMAKNIEKIMEDVKLLKKRIELD